DELGNTGPSLIKSVDIHELIHLAQAGGSSDDGKYDFLVNDIADEHDMPDTLWLSDGRVESVNDVSEAALDGAPTLGALSVHLTATVDAGWNYIDVADPQGGDYRITKIVRDDGTEVRIGDNITGGNAWQTDRTFIEHGQRPIYEHRLHLLDFGGSGHYTITYAPIDSVGPMVVGVTPPEAIVTVPVDSLTVAFSEPLQAGSFDSADLALYRNNDTTNLLGAGVAITPLSDRSYQITGLSALTGSDGTYRFEAQATGVADLFGNSGTGLASVEWTKASAAPAVTSITGLPGTLRNTPVAELKVSFSQPVDPNSLTASDLTLTRDGSEVDLSTAGLTITQTAANAFSISGLSAVTAPEGRYRFEVRAAGILSQSGLAGVGSQAAAWTMDVTAPQVQSIVGLPTDLTNQPTGDITVTFTEPLSVVSFTASDIQLTRNNVTLATTGLSVTALDATRFRISGLRALTEQDGTNRLSIVAAGVTDLAGNLGQGQFEQTWVVDRTSPLPATNLAFAPDSGVQGDRITNVLVGTLSGTVAEGPVTVTVYDDTAGALVGTQFTNTGAFEMTTSFAVAGNHDLRVVVTDAAGNTASTSYLLHVDQTLPFVAQWVNVPTMAGPATPDSIDIVFTEAIAEATLDPAALNLSLDHGANLLPANLSIEKRDDHTFRLSGLAGLIATDGIYRLTLDTRGLHDLADNAGRDVAAIEWEHITPPPPAELHGTLWHDMNEDKVREPDEEALAGWTVFLDGNQNGLLDTGELTTVTDANGAYAFTNLPAGTYVVAEVIPDDWKQTFPGTLSGLAGSVAGGSSASEVFLDDYSDGSAGASPSLGGASGNGYTWVDSDTSTPDVVEIRYDFRDLNGYSNQITPQQQSLAELALKSWNSAANQRVKFVRDTSASAAEILTIGVGDLAALGYTSGVKKTIGLGGGVFSNVDGVRTIQSGVVWLDAAENWDNTYSNGNPSGTYDFFTVAAREIGDALGMAITETSPEGVVIDVPAGQSQTLYFQSHCGCGGTPANGVKYASEITRVSSHDGKLLEALYGGNADASSSSPFYTGSGAKYNWRDADPATPDVIDIYYDFRSLAGYANYITATQISQTELAFQSWETAADGRLNFVYNPSAPLHDIIDIGVGDLAALGYKSTPRGTLGLGGGTFAKVDGQYVISAGEVWLDSAETWDDEFGNGNPAGMFDFFTVVAHEIGHAIGLGHTDFILGEDIMDGRYSQERTSFSATDMRLVQELYDGQSAGSNNTGGGSSGGGNGDGTGDPVLRAGTTGVHIVSVSAGQILTGLDFGDDYAAPLQIVSLTPPAPIAGVEAGVMRIATVTDKNGSADLGSLTATIEWGDGATSTATVADGGLVVESDGSLGVYGQHTYTTVASGLTFRVTVRNGGGALVVASATIDVENPNHTPTDITLSQSTIAENLAAGTTVGTLSTTDADVGDSFTYTLVSGDVGAFQIVGNELRTAASFDYETQSSYTVTVRTTDAGGLTFDKQFTIDVTDVNESPSFSQALYTFAINSKALVGAVAGATPATDPDTAAAFKTLTYSIAAGDPNQAFAIDPNTGVVTVLNPSKLPKIATGQTSATAPDLTISVTDGTNTATSVLRITSRLSPQAMTPIAASKTVTFNTNENNVDGGIAARLAVNPAYTGQAVTWGSVADTSGGPSSTLFAYSPTVATTGTTATIVLKPGVKLDFEKQSSYTFYVTVADSADSTKTVTTPITLNVNDINEAPVISLSSDGIAGAPTTPLAAGKAAYTINEYTSATISNGPKNGDVVFRLSANDQDAGSSMTYALTGTGVTNPSPGVYVDAKGAFQFDAATGAVTVFDATKIDYEKAKTGIGLAFSVTDNGQPGPTGVQSNPPKPLTTRATVTVLLNDLNDSPTFAAAAASVNQNENNRANAVVFTARATDVDRAVVDGVTVAQHLTYSLLSATNGVGADVSSSFAIDPATGKVAVLSANLFDFESAANSKYTLVVRATDDGSPSRSTVESVIGDQTVTLNVIDINEAPVISLSSDGIAGAPTTPLAAGKAAYTINEFTQATTGSSPQNGDVVFRLSAVDPDAGSSLTYVLTGTGVTSPSPGVYVDAKGAFQFDAATGAVTVFDATKIDFEKFKTGIGLAFSVIDNGEPGPTGVQVDPPKPLTTRATVTVLLNDLNDPPTFAANSASVNLAENNKANALLFTAKATDADKPLVGGIATPQHLTYSLVSAVNGVGADALPYFAIDPATGKLTVVSANVFDFESSASSTFTLIMRATDDGSPNRSTAESSVGDQTLTIHVTDVNEGPQAVFTPVGGSPTSGTTGVVNISASTSSVGLIIGNLAVSDPDGLGLGYGSDSLVLTAKDNSSTTKPALVYDASSGALKINDMSTLMAKIGKPFTFVFTVKDKNGLAGALTFTLTLTINVTA
ncbi:MAG: cadherin domain-containing protein, partial [Planctomycetes bacterium]|nr:cadherin domain-containing protein [Planctomycetota bacterium]